MKKYLILGFLLFSKLTAQETNKPVNQDPVLQPLPKLAVAISIDQCRYDYLVRFRPYFVEGGFNRFLDNGSTYVNCRYRHAVTKTGPGHATILSGVHANVHGIVGNDWLDRSDWHQMNCVEDVDSPLVGATKKTKHAPGGGLLELFSGRSPRNFLSSTVGDEIKAKFGASSHVISISNKDRAAILLGGKHADAAYWIENDHFVSSKYYMTKLPDWAAAFNSKNLINSYFGKGWDHLLPVEAYNNVQGPDDSPGEIDVFGLGKVFPRKLTGGRAFISTNYYDAFDITPFSADVLEKFVEEAIRSEHLGNHASLDMLCISYSQIDYVGHAYGPDSHEMMDSILRLDRNLAALFSELDKDVGLKNCVFVLTADHGSSQMPERVTDQAAKATAARLDNAQLDSTVKSALVKAFGEAPHDDFWCKRDNFGYTLHPSALKAAGVSQSSAEVVIKQALLTVPQIYSAYTHADLSHHPEGDSILAKSERSFYLNRSSDVVFVIKPYVIDKNIFGTNHGTPWDYDVHVPMMWYGLGIKPGVHTQNVAVEDIAPTLDAYLGLPRPVNSEGNQLF
jgi:hypothetical protein